MYTCFGYRTKGKCPPRFHLAFDGRGDRETAYRCVCFRMCCVPRVRDASVLAKQIKRRVRIQWATHKPGKSRGNGSHTLARRRLSHLPAECGYSGFHTQLHRESVRIRANPPRIRREAARSHRESAANLPRICRESAANQCTSLATFAPTSRAGGACQRAR